MYNNPNDERSAGMDPQHHIAKHTNNRLANIPDDQLPDLDKATPTDVTFNRPEYWSPSARGEFRRMYFQGLRHGVNKDDKPITCAVFKWKDPDGVIRLVENASVRLVAVFSANHMPINTPVEVTYLGRQKNVSNDHTTAHWNIQLLAPNDGAI